MIYCVIELPELLDVSFKLFKLLVLTFLIAKKTIFELFSHNILHIIKLNEHFLKLYLMNIEILT